jgi:hypothetical protein
MLCSFQQDSKKQAHDRGKTAKKEIMRKEKLIMNSEDLFPDMEGETDPLIKHVQQMIPKPAKLIGEGDLNRLGFRLSGRSITFRRRNGGKMTKLSEVCHEDSKQSAHFCYLRRQLRTTGVILNIDLAELLKNPALYKSN